MFKGIQDALNKVVKTQWGPNEEGFFPVKKAEELLAPAKYQQLILKLPEIMNLDAIQFDSHCATLIDNFSEYVQWLPETQNSYFSRPGGMLDHGLHRATLATTLCNAYFLPNPKDDKDQLTQQQILWAYAVFSAGLLYNVGKIAVDLKVTLIDRQRQLPPTLWNPWESSMINAGTDYQFEFSELNRDDFRRRSTLAIVRQLMPPQGFMWLASDPDVLAAWLAILEEDERASGLLGALIPRADAELILQFFAEQKGLEQQKETKKDKDRAFKLAKHSRTFGKDASKGALATTAKILGGAELGVAFLEWLKKAQESGKLKANDFKNGLHRVQEGALISKTVFESFVKEHKQYKDWKTVALALASLNAHMTNDSIKATQSFDKILHEYNTVNFSGQAKETSSIQGVVIVKSGLVFPSQVTSTVNTDLARKIPPGYLLPKGATEVLGQHTEQVLQQEKSQIQENLVSTLPTPPIPPITPGSGPR